MNACGQFLSQVLFLTLLAILLAGCNARAGQAPSIDWQRIDTGAPSRASVQALIFDPIHPDHLLAAVDDQAGVYASQDGGQTWQPSGDGLDRRQVFALLAGTDGAGLFASAVAGRSWQSAAGVPPTFVAGVWFVDEAGQIAYARTRRGLFRTLDGGRTWQQEAAGIQPLLDACAAGPVDGQLTLAANDGRIYRSRPGATTSRSPWAARSPCCRMRGSRGGTIYRSRILCCRTSKQQLVLHP